ncbi:pentatricopeptide repeat-containing protein At1g30610, chloroplastic-like [Papaver somniferum]|nr:pentatricopeptide repeat-containing protein At1g30610, chloroplastic-like [Papaver somniferum]
MELMLMNSITMCSISNNFVEKIDFYWQTTYPNHGFLLIPKKKPIYEISLIKKMNVFSVRRRKQPNFRTLNALPKGAEKILYKEFKFQPTFDEYLKVMESVKICRENSPFTDSNQSMKVSKLGKLSSKSESDSEDDDDLEEEVRNVELVEGNESGEEKLKVGSVKDRYKRGSKDGSLDKDGSGSVWRSVQHKLKYGENLKVERGLRENGGNRSSERMNGRWIKDSAFSESRDNVYSRKGGDYEKTGAVKSFRRNEDDWDKEIGQGVGKVDLRKKRIIGDEFQVNDRAGDAVGTTDYASFRKSRTENDRGYRRNVDLDPSDVRKSFRSNEDDWEEEFGQHQGKADMQKKRLIQDEFQVSNRASDAAGATDYSPFRKSGTENDKVYRRNLDMDPSERTTNQTWTRSKELYGSNAEKGGSEIMHGRGVRNNEYFPVSNYERKIDETKISRSVYRRKPDENQTPVLLEQHGPRSRNSSSGNWKSIREKLIKYEDDGSDVEMERSAFNSFEEFTDVKGMPRVSRQEMEERIQNLAKWLNGADINLPEWMFSKMMRSAKIRFTDHSLLKVIQVLGRFGNWRRVLQVIEWFQSRERFKSHKPKYIYTAALDVLGKSKRPVEALNIFHEMRQQRSTYPDLAAYHCIAVTLGQAGQMKELLDVIDCMRSPPQKKCKLGEFDEWDPRLEPDLVVYDAVLNACVKNKQWEGAFWVLQQLKEQSLQPSSTTYGLVMEVMLSCEKYNLVHEFFRKVDKISMLKSSNYKILVNTLWKEGKTDEAVAAVKDMERRGIVGTASLYYDLARCLCSAGRCEEALMQIEKLCKVANKPLFVTYTGLIQACLDSGSVQNGSYIFDQMHKFCSPNVVTYNIMLKGYLDHGLFEKAKDLFQQMLDDSKQITSIADYKSRVVPDNYTFNTMLDACIAEKKWDDFTFVYQQMLHHGCHFNTKRHIKMLLEACRAGKGELLETTWKHLIQANRAPPTAIIKERFCMKLEQNDISGAISCITSTSHQTTDELYAFSEKVWLYLFENNSSRFQKDTLIGLIHELNNIIAGSDDRSNPRLENLIRSCKEFIMDRAAESDPMPNEATLV